MKKLFTKSRGFTMIELLVVIAVIGILAVALLATLNPLEQIRKGRDTRRRSDAAQLASGIERYNASLGRFPWQSAEGENLVASTPDIPLLPLNVDANSQTLMNLDALTETSEVKGNFIDRLTDTTATDPHYVYYNDENAGASVTVCFEPESNTFYQEAFERCFAGESAWSADIYSTTGTAINYVYGTVICPDGTAAEYAASSGFDASDTDEMICLP